RVTDAPRKAPSVLVATSDDDVMRSSVKSWSVSTITLSAAPSAVTITTALAIDRDRRSDRTPKAPNGTKSRTFWTASDPDSQRPVTADLSGFGEMRLRWRTRSSWSAVNWNGIVAP